MQVVGLNACVWCEVAAEPQEASGQNTIIIRTHSGGQNRNTSSHSTHPIDWAPTIPVSTVMYIKTGDNIFIWDLNGSGFHKES